VDGAGAAQEKFQLRPQLVELARVTRDDQVGTVVGFNCFGQRQAARRAIELVPALVGAGCGKRWMKEGWHCEGAAAYASARRVQVVEVRVRASGASRMRWPEGRQCPS
jgi:hypothetical protein